MKQADKFNVLLAAVEGLDLTVSESLTLQWLSGLETDTIDNICSIIKKARENKR